MLAYQTAAINAVRNYATLKTAEYQAYVNQMCAPFNVNPQTLVDKVLALPITINFHPDRISNNGKTILQNLIDSGQYRNQFQTGTSNGGTGIYKGGNRYTFEQNLFFDTYPEGTLERPKYGALNIFRYIDGASSRFGSCFFTLKPEIIDRCTFAYGDSSTNPTTLCTSDTFIGIIAAIFEDVKRNNRLLNQVIAYNEAALAIMLNPCNTLKDIGKNLDYCIETHIHGDVSLANDIDSLYIDDSFQGTIFWTQAEELCRKYDIALCRIPKRQINVADMTEFFRGPQIPLLAQKIDQTFGNSSGIINAALIGEASRDSLMHYEMWKEFGTDAELFQYFKQLWHTVAYFG